MPTVGLHVIVKNGEKTLPRLLESIDGAFDEYVFVDTGSTDATWDILAEWVHDHQRSGATLHRFPWVKDFSAARNHAYGLGACDWRMYLDADDALPNAGRLRATIADIAKRRPDVNAISLPYDYGGGIVQDVPFRIVRWGDGWKWFGRIHEELKRNPPGPRVISKVADLVVVHGKPEEANLDSVARNIEILELEYGETHDPQRRATLAYNLGEAARVLGDVSEARRWLGLAFSDDAVAPNIGAVAGARLAQVILDAGEVKNARAAAGAAGARWPEHPEPRIALGMAMFAAGDYERAAIVWDELAALPPRPLVSLTDRPFLEGLRGAYAARTYERVGRHDDAIRELNRAGPHSHHAHVKPHYVAANKEVMKGEGWKRLHALWEFLVWSDEPRKADDVLRQVVPSNIEHSIGVGKLQRLMQHRMRHMESWEAYRRAYDSLPGAAYAPGEAQTAFIRGLGRAQATKAWAEALPKEGGVLRLLSIGAQDGTIEADVLEACPRIHLTVTDASENADAPIRALMERFPGRVEHHQMKNHAYDWPAGPFDAIFIFEVIEHVPEDWLALVELRARLAEGGTLFLSTPVGDAWVNPSLADSPTYDWYGHVRCYNPKRLWDRFIDAGLDGSLHSTDTDSIFFAELHAVERRPGGHAVAIYVPGTPHPFDAESHLRGHLGGSEEAVIHLAEALGDQSLVTVYAPRPVRPDGRVLYGRKGVLWRDVTEFDPEGDMHDAVLFWRCPQLMLQVPERTHYRKLLWLHDTHYGAPREAYRRADRVIVLSNAHAHAVMNGDGFAGPFSYAMNGIDLGLFPELEPTEARDPHRVVYGSSPDRGLDSLLDAWPLVREAVPDATLDVFYTWDLLERAMKENDGLRKLYGRLKERALAMADLGVRVRGGVDHATLAREYRQAGVWAYPTEFFEISCITAMKTMAAGLVPIAFGAGALGETLGKAGEQVVDPGDGGGFLTRLLAALKEPPTFAARKALSDRARMAFGWGTVAARFAEIIEDACRPSQPSATSSSSGSSPTVRS